MKPNPNWTITLTWKAIVIFLIINICVIFSLGLIVGAKIDRSANNIELAMKLTSAIRSGKCQTIDKFITTPDGKWTPDNPVTMIWLRDKKGEVTIAGAEDEGNVRTWQDK